MLTILLTGSCQELRVPVYKNVFVLAFYPSHLSLSLTHLPSSLSLIHLPSSPSLTGSISFPPCCSSILNFYGTNKNSYLNIYKEGCSGEQFLEHASVFSQWLGSRCLLLRLRRFLQSYILSWKVKYGCIVSTNKDISHTNMLYEDCRPVMGQKSDSQSYYTVNTWKKLTTDLYKYFKSTVCTVFGSVPI